MQFSIKKFTVYSCFFLLLGVAVLGCFIYDELSDLENVKEMVAEELERLTHRRAAIGAAELSFAEGVSVHLKNFVLRGAADGKQEFAAEDVWVAMDFWPLLKRRVEIDKIIVGNALVQVIRRDNGRFSFDDLLGLASDSAPPEGKWPELVRGDFLKKLEVKNSRFEFEDHYLRPAGKPARLQIKNVAFSLNQGFFSSPYHFTLRGEVPGAETVAALDVDGKLKLGGTDGRPSGGVALEGAIKVQDLSVPLLREFIPHSGYFLVFDSLPEQSRISLDSNFGADLAGKMHSAGKIQYAVHHDAGKPAVPGKAGATEESGLMEYDVDRNPDAIRFKELHFLHGNFDFKAQGEVSGWRTSAPRVALSMSSSAFMVDKSRDYPALRIFPDHVHNAMQGIFKKGSLAIRSLKFEGGLDELKNPTKPQNLPKLSLEMGLQHVLWTPPLPDFADVNGTLSLRSGEVTVAVDKAKYLLLPVERLTGKIVGLAGNPMMDLRAEGKVRLADIKATLMEIVAPASAKLVDLYQNFTGEGRLVVRVKGPALNFGDIEISGDLQTDNGSFTQKTWSSPVTQVRGKASFVMPPLEPALRATTDFRPWLVRIHEAEGKYGRDGFSQMAGELNMTRAVPFYRLDGKFRLDPASGLQKLVAALPVDEEPRALIKKAEIISGDISMDVHMEGDPSSDKEGVEWGSLELANLSVKMPRDLPPLMNLFATVGFSQDKIQFENVRAYYGDSPFQMHGQILRGPRIRTRFDMYATFRDFYAADLKGIPTLENLRFTGPARLGISLRGQPENYRFENTLDLTRAAYKYKELAVKPAHTVNTVAFQGNIESGKPVAFEKLEIVFGENKFAGKGTARIGGDKSFQLLLTGEELKANAVSQFFPKVNFPVRGNVGLRLQTAGVLDQVENAALQAEMRFKDLIVSARNFAHPLTMSGRVKYASDKFEFVNVRMDSGASQFEVNGNYVSGAAPAAELNLSGQRLVWSDLFQEGQKDFARGLRETVDGTEFLSRGRAQVGLNLARFDFKRAKLSNVTAQLAYKERQLTVEKLSIRPPRDNPIQMQGSLALPGTEGLDFELYLSAKNVRAENMAATFGDIFHNGLSGKMDSFETVLKSRGADWTQMKKTLSGRMSFRVADGEINPSLMKSGVRDLFDIQDAEVTDSGEDKSEKQSNPYEVIQGDFTVNQGVAQTQNFFYATPHRSTTLVGWFDVNRSAMDAVVGVAPLPQLDKFLVRIPVVGKIITAGDEESLVKSYYSIQGPFGNPQVSAIPLTSLERKVIGTFKGILQTPQEILTLPLGSAK